MASSSNDWYFTKEQLESTPSKQCGVEPYKELSYRQQAANFIQDMGQKLKVSQLCINTAIVYMHRFYVFHSFTRFPWNSIAAAALFLAAKVEEQPRKLEHVIRVVTPTKNPHDANFDTNSERYIAQAQDLVFNENILLQTLGFDVAIDHPHTHVVRCCHLVRASKDLAQTSYFMASNSLHLTTMCLQYKPTVVACFCIHFVCKWSNWEIPLSNEKKEWFSYVDETVTSELLEQLTKEFLFIYDRCSSRLKEKIMAIGDGLSLSHNSSHSNSPFEPDKKFLTFPSSDQKDIHGHRSHHGEPKILSMEDFKQRPLRFPHDASSSSQHRDREREYREKKDRERLHHIKPPPPNASSKHPPPQHGHHSHAPQVDPKLNKHSRPPPVGHGSSNRVEPRDILREATRDIGLRDYKESGAPARPNEKRDYPHRPEAKTENNVGNTNYNSTEKRIEPNRPRPSSVDPKQPVRRREDAKPYNKLENDIKKHLSAAIHDKNAFLHKPVNSTSQNKVSDQPKSVPSEAQIKTEKVETHNGSLSNDSSLHLPILDDVKPTEEPVPISTPVKKPSLFSPEKSPPVQKKPKVTPPVKKPNESAPEPKQRNRTSSASLEPELRPVMKKIDHVEGFENIMRDSSIGLKLHQVPEIITPIPDKQEKSVMQNSIAKELKPPDLIPPFNSSGVPLAQPLVNGIETNPSLISSLLKEAPSVPHLPGVAASTTSEAKDHHKEHKKNKKEKHKHKDKEKSREDKEKKKKHKDKDREKHKHKHEKFEEEQGAPAQPIKITIPKDKIQPVDNPSLGLKIKIPKDRIKTEGINETTGVGGGGSSGSGGGGLKIKISKDVINNFNDGKKRERDKNSPTGGPPNKMQKTNHNRITDNKNSAKISYNKVSKVNINGDSSMSNFQTQAMYNGVAHMPGYVNPNASHNYFYNYPPPNMQIPMVPTSLNVPPPPYMYQQYYAGYMYPPDMYAASNVSMGGGEVPPPLPHEPPPNNPPPPPPDY